MIASLIETLNEIIQPKPLSQKGVIEYGTNQNYEYEVWCGGNRAGYYLKIRPRQSAVIFDAPRVVGSFESSQDAINYFNHEYI